MTERAFTRIGRAARKDGVIPPEKIEETVEVVLRQARAARELGAHARSWPWPRRPSARPRTATSSCARGRGGDRPAARAILAGDEEARLSFVGAARTLATPVTGTMAVVDVGGGSTEIAIGSPDGSVELVGVVSRSARASSPTATCARIRPSVAELEAVREHVTGVFEGLEAPPAETAVAVGGTATSLRRLVGAELAHETLERGVRVLSLTPIAEVARSASSSTPSGCGCCPPASSCWRPCRDRLGLPLRIARGGLREGVILELVEAA